MVKARARVWVWVNILNKQMNAHTYGVTTSSTSNLSNNKEIAVF